VQRVAALGHRQRITRHSLSPDRMLAGHQHAEREPVAAIREDAREGDEVLDLLALERRGIPVASQAGKRKCSTLSGRCRGVLRGIAEAAGKAVRKAHRPNAGSGKSQKDVVLDNLDAAIAAASGEGQYRFNSRQVFYVIRDKVSKVTGQELKIGNFNTIITDYESEHGEIPLMYREPRGSIYHPHLRQTITLGTLMVEGYERPGWIFDKVVYFEKEGFAEALKAVGPSGTTAC
jgi:hypothetical protein